MSAARKDIIWVSSLGGELGGYDLAGYGRTKEEAEAALWTKYVEAVIPTWSYNNDVRTLAAVRDHFGVWTRAYELGQGYYGDWDYEDERRCHPAGRAPSPDEPYGQWAGVSVYRDAAYTYMLTLHDDKVSICIDGRIVGMGTWDWEAATLNDVETVPHDALTAAMLDEFQERLRTELNTETLKLDTNQ